MEYTVHLLSHTENKKNNAITIARSMEDFGSTCRTGYEALQRKSHNGLSQHALDTS
jgi:hypothetical protein